MGMKRCAGILTGILAGVLLMGTTAASEGEEITLKVFSNLPDRKNGQGLVEQMIIDEYMAENPDVHIEVEALDEEAYKTKFKAYAIEGMPDVVSIWGQPSFLDGVLEAGVLAELDESDYEDYKFIEGTLEGFKKDGKLYGLPRNTDMAIFYYNERIFQENGWEIPDTYDELLSLAGKINEAGLIPVAMDGGDRWPLAVYYSDLLYQITGDYRGLVSSAIAEGDFSGEEFKQAGMLLKEAVDAGLFQAGFDSQDYGTAMNLFTSGQAAMYYMGTWDASMVVNEDIPEEMRSSIHIFTMPPVKGGKAAPNAVEAWNGGGYGVAADSQVKEEAVRFLNYMYLPDKLSKYGWENGVGLSAQEQMGFMSGTETEVLKEIVAVVTSAANLSGTTVNDSGSSEFKESVERELQELANGTVDIDEFLENIGASCR